MGEIKISELDFSDINSLPIISEEATKETVLIVQTEIVFIQKMMMKTYDI